MLSVLGMSLVLNAAMTRTTALAILQIDATAVLEGMTSTPS